MDRPLTAKGAATRARILAGAADLVRRNGAAGTGLDDIRAATATSKSQLFHYFPDGRVQLLAAVTRAEAEQVLDDQRPHLDDLSTPESWRAWRDVVVTRYTVLGRHCPLGALTGELGRTGPEAGEIVEDLLRRWHGLLADGVRALRRSGVGGDGGPPEAAASVVLAAVQGGVALLRSTGDPVHLERAVDAALEHIGVS